MASTSSSLDVPFIAGICAYPTREALCCECPALLLLVYEHVVAEVQAGRRAFDPFRGTSRQDNLSELLAVRSVAEIFTRLYPDPSSEAVDAGSSLGEVGGESLGKAFWGQTRRTLEAAWASPYDASARAVLAQVRDQPHFHFTAAAHQGGPMPGCGLPLQPVSLEKALSTSKRFLRAATTCALDGSTEALKGGQPELQSVLQLARLVPHTAGTAARSSSSSSTKEVTPEGLNFCMVSLQQRWWVLVSGALERALILSRGDAALARAAGAGLVAVTKPLLWQLLAVLAVLDSGQYIFAFPDKQSDPAGHHLLARLSEVGVIYPLISESQRCFAVSPDFLHALHWHASAPLSLTFTQQLVRGSSGAGSGGSGGGSDARREDADTIITETNFRLYAYTQDPDLLNIIHQFAVLEEVVNASLHCFRVTRDSFAAAMRKGISATQVLRFLSLRAHPSMLRRTEDAATAAAAAAPSSLPGVGAIRQGSGRSSSAAVVDAVAALVVPQSFCDQVRVWENECRRVVFEHHVTLLRNMTAVQQTGVTQFLMEAGEADAVVHVETGYMVLRAEVYERLVAPLLE